MAKNNMKEVAKLLGVEIGEEFKVKDRYTVFRFDDKGLIDELNRECPNTLSMLLRGILEIQKPILTDKEKEYLEGVFKPFKDNVLWIKKINMKSRECLIYRIKDIDNNDGYGYYSMPRFEKNTMYRGMKWNEEYSLEDLGLFK